MIFTSTLKRCGTSPDWGEDTEAMHETLWQIVRRLHTDYEPFGNAEREGLACSSGCRYFIKLAGDVGNDWGVCSNPESPRAGLLTFEHQGCTSFEPITGMG